MMLQLQKIRDCLVSIEGLNVYHYWHPRLQAPYCIWEEDGEGDSLHTNNHKSEQVITGTIDYFTKTEFDEYVEKIQNALNDLENCGWNLVGVDYEDDTSLIHYSWNFQII